MQAYARYATFFARASPNFALTSIEMSCAACGLLGGHLPELLTELINTGKTAKSLQHLRIPFPSLSTCRMSLRTDFLWVRLLTFHLHSPKQDAILKTGFSLNLSQPCLLPCVVSVDVDDSHACAYTQNDPDRLPAALTFLDVSNTSDPEVLGVREVSPSRVYDMLSPLWHCPKLTTFVARDLGVGQLHTCIFCCDLKDLFTFKA